MSNLLGTPLGEPILKEAVRDFVIKKIREWFERNGYIEFSAWVNAGKTFYDIAKVLGSLNPAHDREIYDLFELYKTFELEGQTGTPPITIYVNSVTGNDDTGYGTAAAPFATLTHAQRFLPSTMKNRFRILLTGTFTNMEPMDLTFSDGGQLLIEGTEINSVVPGPFAVTAWTPAGTQNCAFYVQSLLAGWAPGAHKHRFLRVLAGAHAGQLISIKNNTADTLYVGNTLALNVGETFDIVEPGTIINTVRKKISFGQPIYGNARLIFANLKFTGSQIEISSKSTASFVGYFVRFAAGCVFSGDELSVNSDLAYDPSDIVESFPFGNLELNTAATPKLTIDGVEDYLQKSIVQKLETDLYYKGCGTALFSQTYFAQLIGLSGVTFKCDTVAGYAPGSDLISLDYGCVLAISAMWAEACLNVFSGGLGLIEFDGLEGNAATITGYTCLLGPGTQAFHSGAPVIGTLGAIYWTSTGAVVAAWPVAGASVNDGNGSFETRFV